MAHRIDLARMMELLNRKGYDIVVQVRLSPLGRGSTIVTYKSRPVKPSSDKWTVSLSTYEALDIDRFCDLDTPAVWELVTGTKK